MRKAILIALALAAFQTGSLPAQQNQPRSLSLPVPAPIARALNPHPQPGQRPPHPPFGPAQNKPASAPSRPTPVFDAAAMGTPLVLDKGWLVGISADPQAASVSFDDSIWAIRDAADTILEVPFEREGPPPDAQPGGQPGQGSQPSQRPQADSAGGPSGQNPGQNENRRGRFAWFRMHLKLAPGHGPLALMIELPISRSSTTTWGLGSSNDTSVNVYADGKPITPEGPHGSDPQHYQQISRIYRLDVPASATSLTLAIRMPHYPFGFNAYTNFFGNHTVRLGTPDDLERRLAIWNDGTLFERLPRLVYSVVLFVLAAFLFALYYAQPGHNEYLWLALHELAQAPIGFVELSGSTARLDSLWYAALVLQLLAVSAYLFFEFLISFLALKKRWYIKTLRYTAPVLALLGPTLLMVGHSTAIGIVLAAVFVCSLLWLVGCVAFQLITLIAATMHRNFEAGLLLVPLLMSLLGTVEPAIYAGMNELMSMPEQTALTIMAGPIPIHLTAIADFAGVLAIVIIIFMRFLHIQADQQRATSELAAARSVQELMIPQDKVATPGFEVDAVYNPAAEVGGDFYHVQTMRDEGGVLVVIGDVAGKGLQAAMNVSMIMGALRRWADPSPARVLTSLNRVLTGNDSFTTAQAVWFSEDGEVVIANAGHLPPYLNSQEVAVAGGLPLGVVRDVSYDEMRLYLHPGDRLLLMSDGVVEARKPSGELFGFDRVHNMSNQSAFFIADAAKDFGQLDDITVVTVRRLAETVTEASSIKTGLGRLQAVERTAS